MDIETNKENLCYYDTRNPYFHPEIAKPDKPVCYCDNCFYGRTELANEILNLRNNNESSNNRK